MNLSDIKLGIVGLGYVGLPLAVEFGKKRHVVGFDINQKRTLIQQPAMGEYDGIIIAVAHHQFKAMGCSRDPCLGQARACAVRPGIPAARF